MKAIQRKDVHPFDDEGFPDISASTQSETEWFLASVPLQSHGQFAGTHDGHLRSSYVSLVLKTLLDSATFLLWRAVDKTHAESRLVQTTFAR